MWHHLLRYPIIKRSVLAQEQLLIYFIYVRIIVVFQRIEMVMLKEMALLKDIIIL